MQTEIDYWTAKALLDWQVEMGADEAILDAPVNRYDLPVEGPKLVKTERPALPAATGKTPATPAIPAQSKVDPVAQAQAAAQAAQDIPGLRAALEAFDHSPLKAGARNLVFSDGIVGAPVMIIGDAPGKEEDREGRSFAGPSGALLDKMLAAIDMGRDAANASVYLTNALPWRPPQNRPANEAEIAMMLPFLKRHIELAKPKLLILMGNTPCLALIGQSGITRIRGKWTTALSLPALPMFHPTYLMRTPAAKRDAWADLLALKAKLKDLT